MQQKTSAFTRRDLLRLLTGATLLIPLSLTLSGCNSGGSDNAATPPGTSTNKAQTSSNPGKVTIAYNAAIVQPQPLLGLDGAYQKAVPGTTFEGKAYKAGPDVVEALRSGVAEIGCSGAWPAMRAFAKDGDIVLLCGCATGGTQICVANDSPIKTVADLKGKTIGVNQIGSTVETMVRAQIVSAGLDPNRDVKIVAVEPAEQADALKTGDVDAVAAPAPWPSVAQKGGARVLLNSDAIFNNGNYLAGSLYTTKKFADANPEFIRAFIAANKSITDDLNRDRKAGDARVLAAWEKASKKKLDPAVAAQAFKTIKFTTNADAKGLQDFADLALKVGVLKKKADLQGFVFKP